MSDKAVDSSQHRVLGLPLRMWLIFIVAFGVGFAITAVLWAIVSGRDVQTILGLATLAGILATATGTVVLAWKTSDLASATKQMATAALQEAETTARSVELQREELEAVKTQAKLTEDQLRLAREEFEARAIAARPLLEANAWPVTPGLFNVQITWVRGAEPAFAVRVWLKSADGIYLLPLGTLPAGSSIDQRGLRTDMAATNMAWPFPEADDAEPLSADDYYVGLIWQSADRWRGHHLIRSDTIELSDSAIPKERHYLVLVPSRIDPQPARPD